MDKKVIKQENWGEIVVLDNVKFDDNKLCVLVRDYTRLDALRDGTTIIHENRTEVAKAIDPNYQKLEEERDRLLEALKDARQTLAIIDTMVISSPIKNTCKKRISEIDQAIKQSEG